MYGDNPLPGDNPSLEFGAWQPQKSVE